MSRGPKFVPIIVTVDVSDPFVGIRRSPSKDVIDGGKYDVVAFDARDRWSPTSTFHLKPYPTPSATELHTIVVSSTRTAHPLAVYTVPARPSPPKSRFTYVAMISFDDRVGPKLDPLIVTAVEFAVACSAGSTPVIDGASYDVVSFDASDH